MAERKEGLLAALSGYLLWGILPLYWKLLEGVGAYEILAHRILWSFACMVLVLAFLRKGREFRDTVRELMAHVKRGFLMVSAAFLITANWCIFIWAVTHDHIVDSSFGYYINPLVSVFLGVLLFHERLSKLKWFSIGIAFFGILGMSFFLGHFPLVSLGLALTFALYGAAKRNSISALSSALPWKPSSCCPWPWDTSFSCGIAEAAISLREIPNSPSAFSVPVR